MALSHTNPSLHGARWHSLCAVLVDSSDSCQAVPDCFFPSNAAPKGPLGPSKVSIECREGSYLYFSLSLSCFQILSVSVMYYTRHALNDSYFPLYLTITPRFENTDSWRSMMNERSLKVMYEMQNCCFWNDGFRSVSLTFWEYCYFYSLHQCSWKTAYSFNRKLRRANKTIFLALSQLF